MFQGILAPIMSRLILTENEKNEVVKEIWNDMGESNG
jgi:hypothetical protein